MPWTSDNFPVSMKNLPVKVRNKAIEIANALIEEHTMDEGRVIATAISRAKDWAANRDEPFETKSSAHTDVKDHGHDVYVIPYEHNRWAIKTEGNDCVDRIYPYKREAVVDARKKAKNHHGTLTIQLKTGKIEKRISYNTRKSI